MKTVLIVEDDKVLSLLLGKMVQKLDLSLIGNATKGREAIEKVAHPLSQTWDCISINKNTLFTDGAIRVFRRRVVDDCGVGMYKSIILTDYIDVHYKEDIEKIKKG